MPTDEFLVAGRFELKIIEITLTVMVIDSNAAQQNMYKLWLSLSCTVSKKIPLGLWILS